MTQLNEVKRMQELAGLTKEAPAMPPVPGNKPKMPPVPGKSPSSNLSDSLKEKYIQQAFDVVVATFFNNLKHLRSKWSVKRNDKTQRRRVTEFSKGVKRGYTDSRVHIWYKNNKNGRKQQCLPPSCRNKQ